MKISFKLFNLLLWFLPTNLLFWLALCRAKISSGCSYRHLDAIANYLSQITSVMVDSGVGLSNVDIKKSLLNSHDLKQNNVAFPVLWEWGR